MLVKLTAVLACMISVVLSVLILSSLGSGYMAIIFGMTAIVIEVTKYQTFLSRQKRFSFFMCCLLTVLSIGASIGSLQNGLQSTSNEVQKYERQMSTLLAQQEALQASVDKLISMEYITKALSLKPDQDALQVEIDTLPKPALSASYGLVKTVSEVSTLSVSTVSNALYIIIAIVLDLCAFTLLSQERSSETFLPVAEPKPVVQKPKATFRETTTTVTTVQQELFVDDELLSALKAGEVKPSVRAVMTFKGVGYQKSKNALESLVDAGYVIKSETGRYQLEML